MPLEFSVLSQSIFKKIKSYKYECLICCKIIRPSSVESIWTCEGCCYAVFHWKCISKWKQTESRSDSYLFIRCPACRHEYLSENFPQEKLCFCGKSFVEQNSDLTSDHRSSFGSCSVSTVLNSVEKNAQMEQISLGMIKNYCCRKVCGKSIKNCGHTCRLNCHPGPCQSCQQRVSQDCHCGKSTKLVRCQDSSGKFACKKICAKSLGCSRHKCKLSCHEGECPKCSWISLPISCKCGKESKALSCLESTQLGLDFSCNNQCDNLLDCGKHYCTKMCHIDCESKCPQRHRTYCYCGKRQISDETKGALATNCDYVIPSCNSKCGKSLKCGHECGYTCHYGDCDSINTQCEERIVIACQCGNQSKEFSCWQRGVSKFTCDARCDELLSCGKHKCNQMCCSFGNLSETDKLTIRSEYAEPRLLDGGFVQQALHRCTIICGKKLSCNIHFCQDYCHTGRCAPCSLISFDELACHCGMTRVLPPIYCDTALPECSHPCRRIQGRCQEHLYVDMHLCHPEEECPRCSIFVKVACFCGASMLTEECWKKHVKKMCGKKCSRQMPCGHLCIKPCHPGECGPCRVICGKRDENVHQCGHACKQKCHFGVPCSAFPDCLVEVESTCQCGNLKSSISCSEFSSNEFISCSDDCSVKQRNDNLARALCIKPDASLEHSNSNSSIYCEFLVTFAKNNFYFCHSVESVFKKFMCKQEGSIYHFPPMSQLKRRFVCEYANIWSIEYEVVDHEPVRSVLLWKRFSSAPIVLPAVLLSELEIDFKTELTDFEEKLEISGKPTPSNSFYNGLSVSFTEEADFKCILDFMYEAFGEKSFEWKFKDDKLKVKFNTAVSISALKRIKKFILRSVFGSIAEFARLSPEYSSDEYFECDDVEVEHQ